MSALIERAIPLDNIRIDGGTQARTKIHMDTVADYAESMAEGAIFPPATVYFDGKDYWLADGFHRYHATRKNNKTSMLCRINNGTVRDAILYSFGANGLHGMPMSNEDKRRIVLEMLNDFEWGDWSAAEIARRCHVTHVFVSKLRKTLHEEQPEVVKYKTKTGKVAVRKTEPPKKTETVTVFSGVAEVTDKPDEKQETIMFLIDENEKLKDQLASSSGDPEFSKTHIEDLRAELKQTQIELKSVTASRDMYQAECAQLKKQVAYLQRQLKKAA